MPAQGPLGSSCHNRLLLRANGAALVFGEGFVEQGAMMRRPRRGPDVRAEVSAGAANPEGAAPVAGNRIVQCLPQSILSASRMISNSGYFLGAC